MTLPICTACRCWSALTLAGCTDESPEKRIAAAKEYLQKNDTKSAVIEIKNALQKNPELGEARYLLGATLLKEGNVVAAEVELRKALAANHPRRRRRARAGAQHADAGPSQEGGRRVRQTRLASRAPKPACRPRWSSPMPHWASANRRRRH